MHCPAVRPFPRECRLLTLSALIAVLWSGCGTQAYRAVGVTTNQAAPDFVAKGLDSRSVSLASQQGKVVVLFLWAAWECSDELAALDDIASRLPPQRTAIIAVSIDKSVDVVKKIAKSREHWALALLHEPTADVARRYNPRGFPAAYLIDAGGRVRHAHYGVGGSHLRSIEAQVRELIAEN